MEHIQAPKNKIKVGILLGGISAEHEISCLSGASVLKNINRELFEPIAIGIDQVGGFHYLPQNYPLSIMQENGQKKLPIIDPTLPLIPGGLAGIDCSTIFPVLHGPGGEDGEIQRLISALGKKCVGSKELASRNAMDKAAAKKIFEQHSIPTTPGWIISNSDFEKNKFIEPTSFPVFVKPVRSGSSRGTHKVKEKNEYLTALKDAFTYDHEVLVESAINAREIEVGILEMDGKIIASKPGEIKIDSKFEFYDFEAKYLDGATTVEIPAPIPEGIANKITDFAIKAFKAIGANGFARVDFFLDKNNNSIYLNEINTIPGFTATSVYPKLMECVDIPYAEIITALITSAS